MKNVQLESKILYFGSHNDNIKEISSGKFLTSFKSIACCFAINLEEVYGDLNKKYTSINWGYDQWSKSKKYLEKQEIPKLIKITNNAKDWIKTEGKSIGYLYSIDVDDYLLNNIERFLTSDPELEVIYTGKKKLPVKLVKKLNLNWECEFSELKYNQTIPEIKNISFPINEINTLKNKNNIITTRVSADYNTFFKNDIVKTPWDSYFIISDRIEITNINKHPYYDELTKDQIKFLSKYNKIAILTLEKIVKSDFLLDKEYKLGYATIGAEKYEKPYDVETLKELYPKLLDDPVHKWRAKNGIELIHKEPDFQEQKRIFYNWNIMPKTLQEKSDKKSKQLFKCSNLEYHNWIMENEWHDENYFELTDCRQRYDKRDMEENGLKYIHISLSNKPITFIPRIPENVMDLRGKWKQFSENNKIPRICCSNSIFGAIAAIKIQQNKTYYVHLLEPKKVVNNQEVAQYVPDALATGECWILDDEIKSTVVGKIEIGSLLPYVYTFLKDDNNFKCVNYHDYTFISYETKFNRAYRKTLNKIIAEDNELKITAESIKKSIKNIFKSELKKESDRDTTITNVCKQLRLFPLIINGTTSLKTLGKYENDYMIICYLMNDSISLKVFSKDDEKPISKLKTITIKNSDTEQEIIEKLDKELVMTIGIKFTSLSNKIKKSFDKNPIFD